MEHSRARGLHGRSNDNERRGRRSEGRVRTRCDRRADHEALDLGAPSSRMRRNGSLLRLMDASTRRRPVRHPQGCTCTRAATFAHRGAFEPSWRHLDVCIAKAHRRARKASSPETHSVPSEAATRPNAASQASVSSLAPWKDRRASGPLAPPSGKRCRRFTSSSHAARRAWGGSRIAARALRARPRAAWP